jgi:hypothetical protein
MAKAKSSGVSHSKKTAGTLLMMKNAPLPTALIA